ncbi:hypothetical protein BRC90_01330 [Halobacteriales archaeon QS_4_69_34]|nr:MAG: hypothetical protein BRC90_01330 [Halobacteriales archaeon QS_4_69_34]
MAESIIYSRREYEDLAAADTVPSGQEAPVDPEQREFERSVVAVLSDKYDRSPAEVLDAGELVLHMDTFSIAPEDV